MDLFLPHAGLIFWTVFSLTMFALPLLAVLNLVRSTFKDSNTKLLWALIILMVPIAGPIMYFTIGKTQRVKIAN